MAPVRVDDMVVEALTVESDEHPGDPSPLAAIGSSERWQQLQRLRRGQLDPEPLVSGLISGDLAPHPDLLAALWGQLDRNAVERLLDSAAAHSAAPWLEASRQELPTLASHPAVERAWLEPLLTWQQQVAREQQLAWLEVLAHFQDPRVAQRLRRVILETSRQGPGGSDQEPSGPMEAMLPLLPLLGRQRQRQDGVLLLQCSLDPGPLVWRQAALEGVALGLSTWPLPLLTPALLRLAGDLSATLAGQAVDLLARLPDGQRQLQRLASRSLDPAVRERLRRRRRCTPLVLVVHGRQGGVIPALYQDLAQELQARRRAPVLLQALTGDAPPIDARLRQATARAGGLTVVPLLLLPGEHVRRDVPAIAAGWRDALAASETAATVSKLRRVPFLGAWPGWQQLLARELPSIARGRSWIWLHHPLQGPLAHRYLRHLGRILGRPGQAAAEPGSERWDHRDDGQPLLLAPLGLAPNRFSESLRMEPSVPSQEVLPPLLELPAVRECLLSQLEALP